MKVYIYAAPANKLPGCIYRDVDNFLPHFDNLKFDPQFQLATSLSLPFPMAAWYATYKRAKFTCALLNPSELCIWPIVACPITKKIF